LYTGRKGSLRKDARNNKTTRRRKEILIMPSKRIKGEEKNETSQLKREGNMANTQERKTDLRGKGLRRGN